jgi:hypothetical protein
VPNHAAAHSVFPAKTAIVDVNPPASPWIDKSVAAQRAEKAGLAAPRSEVTLDFVPPVTRTAPKIPSARRGRSDWTHSLTNSLRMTDTALVGAAVFAGFVLTPTDCPCLPGIPVTHAIW